MTDVYERLDRERLLHVHKLKLRILTAAIVVRTYSIRYCTRYIVTDLPCIVHEHGE